MILYIGFMFHTIYFVDELIRQDPNFDFEPVGVEITAVVSHSPDQSQEHSSIVN